MTSDEIKQYFNTLATSHVNINHFVYGDDVELLEAMKNIIAYPAMMLELPEIGFSGDFDSLVSVYQVGCNILTQVFADERANVREVALNTTELIARQVVAKILVDFSMFKITKIKLTPITNFSHDNLFGWRIYLEIPTGDNLCVDELVWL